MAFLSGPRQVGKSTVAKALGGRYLSWDRPEDRAILVQGPRKVAEAAGLDQLVDEPHRLVLDEIHRFGGWRDLLKSVFDAYEPRVLATGSARLDVFSHAGDALVGRYFSYRMHPLSLGETTDPAYLETGLHRPPAEGQVGLEDLLRFSGFPEPLARGEASFHRRWVNARRSQLLREELRDLTSVREIDGVLGLADLVRSRVGGGAPHRGLAQDLAVSPDTVARWLETLASLYHLFEVRPWFRNIARALRKQPKYYLWDHSQVPDPAARFENLVACALKKTCDLWTDVGAGDFDLRWIRDREGNEVDFVVVRDGDPWILVEAKMGARDLSGVLSEMAQKLAAPHAFQIVLDMPFVAADPFDQTRPVVVPAKTFLSQLP